jgi:hypothetical protein
MHTMLQKIVQESKFTPNTHNLENLLFQKLQNKIQLKNRIILSAYVAMSSLSSILLCVCATYLYIDMSNSQLSGYFNLIIGEDLQTLATISKEILYVLFESLPMMSLTLTLGLLFMVMVSVNGILSSLQKNHTLLKTN